MNIEKLKLKIDLVKARMDILKLKADQYHWSVFIPDDVKEDLEATLVEIDSALTELAKEPYVGIPLPHEVGG